MARLSSANPPSVSQDINSINLTRLVVRLQQTLNSPDADVALRLRKSSSERERVGNNLQYAKNLLLTLEQDALQIKVQSKKTETQTDLLYKRDALQRLSERLDELNEFAEASEDETSEGEDLLGEDTPSVSTDEQTSPIEQPEPILDPPVPPLPREPSVPEPTTSAISTAPPPTSTLRPRQTARAELFSDARASGASTSTSPAPISATTEALLTHNRTEQEAITNSLLAMATALKESSKAFGSSLEAEKSTLNRAVEGLDKNEIGLEAASKRMGHLRSLTEGKGWWGRMLLYAYIAGLAVLAILLVFVGPKLRF